LLQIPPGATIVDMQWGGSLGSLFDAMTETPVTVRAFGSFDGTIAHPDGPAILQPLLLEAVRAAAAQHGGRVLDLVKEKDAIARAAQAHVAPRLHHIGAVGQLSIGAFTFDPEDHERLKAFSMKLALAKQAARAAEAAAASTPATAPAAHASADTCTKCGAPAPGKFCRECGAARAAAAAVAGPTVERPRGGGAIASVVKGPFPPRTSLIVDDGYAFFGITSTGAAIELSSGTDSTLEACELGVYVRKSGFRIRAEGPGGQVLDAANTPRDVHVTLFGRLDVDDPVMLARGLGDRAQLDDTSTRMEASSALMQVVQVVVQHRFGSGAWTVAMLEGTWENPGEALAEVGPTIAAAYLASSHRIPGTKITISGTTLAFPLAAGVAAPAPPAPPAPAPLPVGAQVLVQWSDGQRYPGVVRESREGQVLIVFPNGGLQWIPTPFVSRA
jgi:hypothetical protein